MENISIGNEISTAIGEVPLLAEDFIMYKIGKDVYMFLGQIWRMSSSFLFSYKTVFTDYVSLKRKLELVLLSVCSLKICHKKI